MCYRLWSQDQHEQLAAYASAEILSADLAGLALQLGRWGVTPGQLVWLDIPPAAAYAQAQDLLERLGALEGEALTRHGQAMAELPAHPRIAHLLLRGQTLGLADMACDVAALLGERDILRGAGADLHSRLVLLSGEERAARGAQGGIQRARQLARQYRGYLRGKASEPVSDPEHPRDEVMGVPSWMSLGFLRPGPQLDWGSSRRAFGTPGAGGSFGFADPDGRLGDAYVMNNMEFHMFDDPREKVLRDAVHRSIRGLSG